MLSSFYNSVSGVKAQQYGMDLTANNVSNVNTNGYKASYAEFKDFFHKSIDDGFMGPTNDQVGHGATAAASALDMQQGVLLNTDNNFDLAIAGDGWFNVASASNAEPFYSRDGAFYVNGEGQLVNGSGHYLMGINANNITNEVVNPNITLDPTSTQMGPIDIPTQLTFPGEPTTEVNIRKNLEFGSTYQKQSIGIVTPAGEKTDLVIEFTPSATQPAVGSSWDYSATIDGSSAAARTGTLTFDSSGAMTQDTTITMDNFGTNLSFDLGGGFDGIISTTGDVDTSTIANGKPIGELDNYRVDGNGNIVASFDNSESVAIGKIPIYHFRNDQGLEKVGQNLFRESENSGEAKLFVDENGKDTMGASILSHKLEGSNVNLSDSLTNLIVYQKAFDASARGITTSDQMIQTAINLKR